jgi:hypothetical protein
MIKVTYSRHFISDTISTPVTFVDDEGNMYLCDGDERNRILVSAIRNVEVIS